MVRVEALALASLRAHVGSHWAKGQASEFQLKMTKSESMVMFGQRLRQGTSPNYNPARHTELRSGWSLHSMGFSSLERVTGST